MNPLQQLSEYLHRIERNLRLLTFARGMAILFAAALLVTLALVLLMNAQSFSNPSIFYSRLILFFILAAALAIALITPLLRLNQRRAAREAERLHPELGQRLLTFVERRGHNDAFLPLLAADALPFASSASPSAIAAPSRAMLFGGIALLAAFSLLWLGLRGPAYLGYGTSLLWGMNHIDSKPFYSISLEPGSARVRRHSDLVLNAHLHGFFSQQASLLVRYQSATRWEQAPMLPARDSAGFQFQLVGIPEDVEYYVVSNGIHSPTSKLTAVDLPAITHLTVTYHFPALYGQKDETEDPGGDLRAIQGTVADVEITTDKPLSDGGSLVLDDGKKIALTGQSTTLHASVPIEKDGTYHVAAMDSGQPVRLSDDYFIEARRDSPPTISILRPTRDPRVTPIEEVPIEIEARDDYGVNALDLHYSVNGAPEQVRSLLSGKGVKDAKGSSVLSMEDFKLVPGDVVSLYATARDAKTTARSDIYFVEARPFELDYHQDQSSGQGGGSQDDPKIAERQKEIIAATFNQIRTNAAQRDAKAESENAKYLSGVQSKLRDEAQSLNNRMKARQIQGNGAAFQQFSADMEAAIAVMGPASDELKGQKWNDALSPEQKALQYLLRAEAIFRDIQVQISRNGGGGGGQSGASRDLEGLTNLELDTQKNQYESGSQSLEDQKQKEADEALKKLEELARRQQELAQQAQNKQNFQQRWEQEMLRREAEQLRQKLQELAQNQQQSQPSDQQSGQQNQQQGQQSGQQGQQGQKSGPSQGQQSSNQQSSNQQSSNQQSSNQQGQSQQAQNRTSGRNAPATQQALEQAIKSLSEATRNMGDAASHGSPSQSESAAQELSRAQSALSGMRRQQNGSQMSELKEQARRLSEKQQGFDQRLRQNFAGEAAGNRSDQANAQIGSKLAQEKQREIDDLHELEKSLSQTARGMQNTQPDAAKKLREAIGEMQQNEIESRMKWTADALNRGLGSYAVMREAPVTQALNQLKDQLGSAESLMKDGKGEGPGDAAMQQALARAEQLRKDIEAKAGRQPGDRKSGQTGQGQEPGQGQQPGQTQAQNGQLSSASSTSGSTGGAPGFNQQGSETPTPQGPRGNSSARSGGGSQDTAGPGEGLNPETVRNSYQEALNGITRLQQQVRAAAPTTGPDTAKDLQDVLRDLQHLDPNRAKGNPDQLAALEQQILADVEQAELLIRRRVEDESGSIRTTAPQSIPPGYANAVAEYFRKLSR